MRLKLGTELSYTFDVPTPMIVMLNVHPDEAQSLEYPDTLATNPIVNVTQYRDGFGNLCCRLIAPPGPFTITTQTVIWDDGLPDPVDRNAVQHAVEDLPDEVLSFLLPSRYCESDKLADEAWRLFGNMTPGWDRVQAICDHVNGAIKFDYQQASPFRSAADVHAGSVFALETDVAGLPEPLLKL